MPLSKPQRYCWLSRDMLNRPPYNPWWRVLEPEASSVWHQLVDEYQMMASGALASEIE